MADSNAVEDVHRLTDDQLFHKLKDLGIDVGPVVATTRQFYERKLQKVLSGEAEEPKESLSLVNGDSQAYSDSDVDESFCSPEPNPIRSPSSAAKKAADTGGELMSEIRHIPVTVPDNFRKKWNLDDRDTPTPRRSLKDVRHLPSPSNYPIRRSVHDKGWSVSPEGQIVRTVVEQVEEVDLPTPPTSWVRILVKLAIIMVLVATAYFIIRNFQSEQNPFSHVEEAARAAVKRAQQALGQDKAEVNPKDKSEI